LTLAAPQRGLVTQLAREYRVERQTIYNDLRFLAAVNQVVQACGEAVRSLILSRRVKGTSRRYIQALAKQDAAEQRRRVAQAEADGRWPDEAADEQPDTMTVPRDVMALARALKKKLSADEWAQLGELLR
jgi:hypothetical protein